MIKNGLIAEPEFDNPNKYLKFGSRTVLGEEYLEIVKDCIGKTDGLTIRNLLVYMHNNTSKAKDSNSDSRKFKRTAEEILSSGEVTGCCDNSTLFVTLARCAGIPAMQVITFDKEKAKNGYGHYFSACYLKDSNGNYQWMIVDSARKVRYPQDVVIKRLDLDNRNITTNYYAFAYALDYSELGIDSIQAMNKIQSKAFDESDKNDFSNCIESIQK